MAKPFSNALRLRGCLRAASRPVQRRRLRCFSATAATRTDGVFSELTAMRTRIPFIEAFKKQQEEKKAGGPEPQSTDKPQRDLSPKTMADSHHQVVSHV